MILIDANLGRRKFPANLNSSEPRDHDLVRTETQINKNYISKISLS